MFLNAAKRIEYQPCSWFLFSLVILFTGCTADSDSGIAKDSAHGAIAFQLTWNDGRPQKPMKNNRQLMADDICTNYNIQWISAKAVDQEGNEKSNAKWLCKDKRGELSGLPEGTYTVIIQGETDSTNAWQGEASGIEVIKDQLTDAGQVTMKHLFDHEAPTVVKTVPANAKTGVPVNSAVTATFDSGIVGKSIDAENFFLTPANQSDGETPIECTVSYDASNHIAVLTPTAYLRNDTAYTATIAVNKGLVVEDMAANPMQQAVQWTFTTFRPDNEGPRVDTRSPMHGDTNLELQAVVQISFSEPINPLTINSDSIYLHCNGTRIRCALSYDDQLNIVTLTPASDLPTGSTCQVVVTTTITDLSGNELESNETWAFVTQFHSWYTERTEISQAFTIRKIALASNGRPHISIPRNGFLNIYRTAKNTWEERSLIIDGAVSFYHDMVISSGDMIYTIAWSTSEKLQVGYQSVELAGPIMNHWIAQNYTQLDPRGVSIAIAEKVPVKNIGAYACYYDAKDSQLVFAAEHTDWVLEVVDTDAGEYPSMAVEPTGEAHISYFDAVSGHLKYATNKSGTWAVETIDNSGNVGRYTEIALDATGKPHICYHDNENILLKLLKYAAKQSSDSWLIETVDVNTNVSSSSSIAIDLSGLAHIGFYDHSNANLMYATRTAIGSWHVAVVDNYGSNGTHSSIIIDKEGFIHIAYGYEKPGIMNEFVGYATTRPQE